MKKTKITKALLLSLTLGSALNGWAAASSAPATESVKNADVKDLNVVTSREELKNVPSIEKRFEGDENAARLACRGWIDERRTEFRSLGMIVLRQDCVPFVSSQYEAGYRGVVYFHAK